jgi:hypothetical protein
MGVLPLFGFLPPFWALVAGFIAAVVGSLARPRQAA